MAALTECSGALGQEYLTLTSGDMQASQVHDHWAGLEEQVEEASEGLLHSW